ncbi:hypothetical protein ACVDFE_22100 [Lentzea chajnantorensis]
MRTHLRTRWTAPVLAVTAVLLASAAVPASAATTTALGSPQVVPIPDSQVRWYANDSTFPYLPNATGTANLTFWVDGVNYRSTGQTLDTMSPVNPTTAVPSAGPKGSFDGNGAWLFQAVRDPEDPSGAIYGFYHAEDHVFADGVTGYEYNSTGLAVSTDDGVTWTKEGQIIGTPQPQTAQNGGPEINSVVYDPIDKRWLGIGHGIAYASTDPGAAPGTWKGWDGSAFTVSMPSTSTDAGKTKPLSSLGSDISDCNLTWNTYLGKFVLVYKNWGDNTHVYMKTSADGITWGAATTLLTAAAGKTVGYPQLIGTSSSEAGQQATLVYEQWPSTTGRNRDMVERTVQFTTG